jgi:starch phosphorylase
MSVDANDDGPKVVERLRWLAHNLSWAWQPEARELFSQLNPDLWEIVGRNPAALLRDLGPERVATAALRPGYVQRLERVVESCERYLREPRPLAGEPGTVRDELARGSGPVAYFCAEFGIHESLPIYAGGLGILAGDHLKSASDLGIPLVAVGLLYREGYLRQRLEEDGTQVSEYPRLDFERQPLELLRDVGGAPLSIVVDVAGRPVTAQIWRARVGRVPLYLLDTDVGSNAPGDRWISARLYAGGLDNRIAQEIVLGVGGPRALRLLGIQPSAWHMNEGHSAFLTLELVRERMVGLGESLETARAHVASRTLFTTHTPVPAGHDRFPHDLVERHLGELRKQLGLTVEQFRDLARDPDDSQDRFCMTVLALKTSGKANGVSALHGDVSRRMWRRLFPDRSVEAVPIEHVTNGIHAGTWIGDEMRALLDRRLGAGWLDRIHDPRTLDGVDAIPDEELWAVRLAMKEQLVAYARMHVAKGLVARGREAQRVLGSAQLLDAPVLTIGFARRFATYKRADLLFSDVERAVKLLDHATRPVQVIFAGKAHPQDTHGQDVIRRVVGAARHPRLRNRVVFLEDYDVGVARELVQGVDVWLNNPRRPHEASGTSGQKAALNGILNVSILDGWWCEGFAADPESGFAIGDERVEENTEAQDRRDGEALYATLEKQVVPLYYERDARGTPRKWVARVKHAIKSLGARYNTHRMVLDYARNYYVPASRGELGASRAR